VDDTIAGYTPTALSGTIWTELEKSLARQPGASGIRASLAAGRITL
jgi:hypothetical protein